MLTAFHIKANGEIEKVRASTDLPLWSELPEGEDYICIHCGQRVILRKNYYKGHRIPHFAHKVGPGCKLWEPESEEHMLIKGLVADIFSSFADVEIEKRDGAFSGEYYPDIYVELGNIKIAVEIQCSNKPTKDIIEKTKWYSKHGVYALWLWRFPEDKDPDHWGTSAQERLMVEWYGFIPFITTEGEIYLAFKRWERTNTIWKIELISFKLSEDTIFSWFRPIKRGELKLFAPSWEAPWGIQKGVRKVLENWERKTFKKQETLPRFSRQEKDKKELEYWRKVFEKQGALSRFRRRKEMRFFWSYKEDVENYVDIVYNVIHNIGMYDYADIKALSDEGYELISKLRRSARRFEYLARFNGKYSHLLWDMFREKKALIRDVRDAVSDLWDVWSEYRRVDERWRI